MSLYVDYKFIGLISHKLAKFTKKNNDLYNFRCPYCGDSKKSKVKSRGYFYRKRQTMYFRCHNCGRGNTLGTFIEGLDPALYREYQLEQYKEGRTKTTPIAVPDEFRVTSAPKFCEQISALDHLERIYDLADDHFARAYVYRRQIPVRFFSSLYFASDFRRFIQELVEDHEYQLKPNDPRLVIPFYDRDKRLIAVQGRALEDSSVKYITIKVRDVPRIFGMDRADMSKRLYVVEGPIDSMFLPNAIAAAGADFPKLDPAKCTFVFDNQPRNAEVCARIKQAIDGGYTVTLWPDTVQQKDINDMILAGRSQNNIMTIIDAFSYQDLEARMRFTQWRKC